MYKIAVPYFPGSNGDQDSISRIKEFGMEAVPLYFHIGDEQRLDRNAHILTHDIDGVVLPGGFPYEDRVDYGLIPARIPQFRKAMRAFVESGKPVLAFCSGNQVAHAMNLAFAENSPHRISMLRNICDKDGRLLHNGFMDRRVYTKVVCDPHRSAFTQEFKSQEILPEIIDHGGGRFWADKQTLDYILANNMILTQYCDKDGNVVNDFPINPNGAMLNIESITNARGNLKIGMCHNERKLNALTKSRANLVFESMRKYLEAGCPQLDIGQSVPLTLPAHKDYSYISHTLNPDATLDIYIKMLTDDNECTTARLFLGGDTPIQRRRLLRLEVDPKHMTTQGIRKVFMEVAALDLQEGVMLKKDLPYITAPELGIHSYEVVGKDGNKLVSDFKQQAEFVPGFSHTHMQVSLPNPDGYFVRKQLWQNPFLKDAVKHVHTGRVWFFKSEPDKQLAIEKLLS